MNTIVLQELSTLDIQELVKESAHAFLPSKHHPDATIVDLLDKFQSDPEFKILGYMMNGKTASYIVALSDTARDNSIAIGPMYVGEAYRGQGLGTMQVADFIDRANKHGLQHVFTKTWGSNTASRAIFERLGFVVESVIDDDRTDGDSTVCYVKELNNR